MLALSASSSPPRPITFTHAPNPAAELKRLFPSTAFSALTGAPLHFTAYGADPKSTPTPTVGVAF